MSVLQFALSISIPLLAQFVFANGCTADRKPLCPRWCVAWSSLLPWSSAAWLIELTLNCAPKVCPARWSIPLIGPSSKLVCPIAIQNRAFYQCLEPLFQSGGSEHSIVGPNIIHMAIVMNVINSNAPNLKRNLLNRTSAQCTLCTAQCAVAIVQSPHAHGQMST